MFKIGETSLEERIYRAYLIERGNIRKYLKIREVKSVEKVRKKNDEHHL